MVQQYFRQKLSCLPSGSRYSRPRFQDHEGRWENDDDNWWVLQRLLLDTQIIIGTCVLNFLGIIILHHIYHQPKLPSSVVKHDQLGIYRTKWTFEWESARTKLASFQQTMFEYEKVNIFGGLRQTTHALKVRLQCSWNFMH